MTGQDMSERKLCALCHYANFSLPEPKCMKLAIERDDLVYGKHRVVDCRPLLEIRADDSACGPDGKFWDLADWLKRASVKEPVEPELVNDAKKQEDAPPWWKKAINSAWGKL